MADPATAESIGAALFDALATLGPDGDGTFALVDWFASEPTRRDIEAATLGQDPACLLSFEGEDPVPTETVITLAGGLQESVSRGQWRVYVVNHDLRGDGEAAVSDRRYKGYLALIGKAKSAVLGLRIEGLDGDSNVRFGNTRRVRAEGGVVYAYAVTVTADYADAQAAAPDTSRPFHGIDATINDPDITDPSPPAGDPNPMDQLRVRF